MQPSRYKQSGIVPVIGKLFKGNRSADQRRDLEVGFLRPDVARRPWLTSFGLAVSAKLEVKACVAEPKGAGRDGDSVGAKGNASPSAMPRLRVVSASKAVRNSHRLTLLHRLLGCGHGSRSCSDAVTQLLRGVLTSGLCPSQQSASASARLR